MKGYKLSKRVISECHHVIEVQSYHYGVKGKTSIKEVFYCNLDLIKNFQENEIPFFYKGLKNEFENRKQK